MNVQVAKGKRRRRPLPPGQKLLLLLVLGTLCCTLTIWLLKPHPNMAQQPVSVVQAPLVTNSNGASTVQQYPVTVPVPAPFQLRHEISALAEQVRVESNKPNLKTGVFVVEPDTGNFIEIDARRAYPAASMIKLPVLISLLEAIDAKKVRLDQPLVVRKDLQCGGSGWLQYRPAGTIMSVKDTAELMMIISDNTATNMIIDLLGGMNNCNQDFVKMGLTQTQIRNALPDLTGTNTTCPYDLALLLAKVDAGQLVSPAMRSWMLTTMERSKIRSLLPQGLPPGTKIADKTGDIAGLVGDAGIITTKDGKRYIATVEVERPTNDRRANQLIRVLSKDIYVGITGDSEGVKNVLVDKPHAARAPRRSGRRRRHARRN